MAKRQMNFRLSDEAASRLAELASERGVSQGQVIEGLVLGTGAPKVVRREVPGAPISEEEAARRGLVRVAGGGWADPDKIGRAQKKFGMV